MVFPFTQNICVTTRTNQVGGDRKNFNNPPVCTCPSLVLFTGSSPSFGHIPGMKGSWNETSFKTPPPQQEGGCVYHTSTVDSGIYCVLGPQTWVVNLRHSSHSYRAHSPIVYG